MQDNHTEKKTTWRNWLIKKLLVNETSKEDILNFIANDEDEKSKFHNNEFEDNNEKNLIKNILKLNEISVEDIMVPRAKIISIEKNKTTEEILSVIDNESHSRMPVFENNLDNVLGFLHVKDLIKNNNENHFELKKIIRDILYVAPKSPILDLLKRMRLSRIHMGLVVDEFGGVDGLVTIEDLVEEIVGEIEDEHDAEDNIKFQKINETKIVVDAAYKLNDLEKYYSIKITEINEEEIDTVGGLAFFLAGKVPKNQEIFQYNNFLKFKILSATDRRINTLEIDKIK